MPFFPPSHRRRGIALVWFAIFSVLIVLMLGLAIDQAHVGHAARELHNTCDAAALGGALFVRKDIDLARDKARELGAANRVFGAPIPLDLNPSNHPAGDIVVGRFNRETRMFTPTEDAPNAVEVRGWRAANHNNALPLIFTPFFDRVGFGTSDVQRRSIAMNLGGTGAGILVLDPSNDCAFRVNGNMDLVVLACTAAEEDGGEFGCADAAPEGQAAIQVDSDSDCAACTSGSSVHIEAPALNVVGEDPGLCLSGNPDLDIPEVNPGSPYVPDPLAEIPEPEIPGVDLGSITNDSGYWAPGYYSDGIRQTANNPEMNLCLGPEPFACPPPPDFEPSFATDEPAIYFLEGDGLTYSGGNLYAYQTMFFINEGPMKLTGNGELVIQPADLYDGGEYGGISVFQARDNDSPSVIIGTDDMILQGTYYFPAALLEVGGTGIAVGNQVISWQFWIHGSGEFNINYDGRFPAPGNKIFLVY